MKAPSWFLNCTVAAFCTSLACAPAYAADQAKVDDLLARLAQSAPRESMRIERELVNEWSKSGSAAMDLLLQRGRDALDEGKAADAIAHFTALTDHAPDFAEGWHGLASAYYTDGKFGPAVQALAHCLTLNPKNFSAMQGWALINEETNRPAQALAIYRAALAIHPHLVGVSEAMKRLEQKVAGTDL